MSAQSQGKALLKDTEGKFEYDVAARPEPINLQQGTDLYMFNSATPATRCF